MAVPKSAYSSTWSGLGRGTLTLYVAVYIYFEVRVNARPNRVHVFNEKCARLSKLDCPITVCRTLEYLLLSGSLVSHQPLHSPSVELTVVYSSYPRYVTVGNSARDMFTQGPHPVAADYGQPDGYVFQYMPRRRVAYKKGMYMYKQ